MALSRSSMAVLFMGLLVALAACVESHGYYGGYNRYYGSYSGYYGDGWPGYYEPYGFYPTTWGPAYYVAPFRDREFEEHRKEEFREHHRNNPVVTHAFRAAPTSGPVPSIPSRASSRHWHSGDRDAH